MGHVPKNFENTQITIYEDILNIYRSHYYQLIDTGASESEAGLIAAAMAATAPSATYSKLVSEKEAYNAKTYLYRGTILNVVTCKTVHQQAGDTLNVTFLVRVGNGAKELRVKGNQALTITALLLLKYEQFSRDLSEGFTWPEVRDRELKIISDLQPNGWSLTSSDLPENTHRHRIGTKLAEVELDHFINRVNSSNHYRIEMGPNNIRLTPQALQLLDSLSSSSVSRWFAERNLGSGESTAGD